MWFTVHSFDKFRCIFVHPSVSIDCWCIPVIEHTSLLFNITPFANLEDFSTEISAPESTRNVHLGLKFCDSNSTKLDNAVFMLKICFIGVVVEWLLTPFDIAAVPVVGSVVLFEQFVVPQPVPAGGPVGFPGS